MILLARTGAPALALAWTVLAAAVMLAGAACGDVNTELQHQSEARHRSADLLVQADPEDASIDVMEKRMAAAEAAARRSLDALTPLVAPASRAPCEESLRALRDALNERGYPAGRVSAASS
jgi:hypothetical protein